ncbi:MAG TPA: sigma factor-like helix-turn-helix DNA-binding protein, partial [Chiayiivirga sp.]|nr:sigma factor-like helix-turn-helix DNA-binding protein [Chiayiivirga sp.]
EAPAREPADHAEASGLLRHLTPQARALVWLNQVEGWSHQALGRRFGRSESWSKSIVSRALAQLRDIADHPGTPTHEH